MAVRATAATPPLLPRLTLGDMEKVVSVEAVLNLLTEVRKEAAGIDTAQAKRHIADALDDLLYMIDDAMAGVLDAAEDA